MTSIAPAPRSRGSLSGVVLVVLGAWGGLAPFVGHYLSFGFTPDRAWAYTQGRLYLSAVPGGVVLIAGLVIAATRSRWLGGFAAFLASIAGAWFIVGDSIIRLLPGHRAASINPGLPLGSLNHALLENLSFFAGLGALIVFFAALALGRLSLEAYKDYLRYGNDAPGSASPYLSTQPIQPTYPAGQDPLGQDSAGQDPFGQGGYPTAASGLASPVDFATGQDVTRPRVAPPAQSPFPPVQNPFPPAQQ